MEFEPISNRVIGFAVEVHRHLGPGLLESAYETCLAHELDRAGISYERQEPVPVTYKGLNLDCGYRIDILVEDALVLELKSIERLLPVHDAQLLTYMKLARKKIGLLFNFKEWFLKDGIKRMVL